jgi:hypothetical protein
LLEGIDDDSDVERNENVVLDRALDGGGDLPIA